jgi:predicted DNA-binding transcriptional regulator AlpA
MQSRISPLGLVTKQVAERLGLQEDTIYRWRNQKVGPPYYKIRNTIYYKPEDIDAWIEAQRVEFSDRGENGRASKARDAGG